MDAVPTPASRETRRLSPMATVTIPYRPREVFKPFHGRAQRFAVGVAHRRCGKTVGTVNDMIKRAVISQLPAYKAAYIAPYRNQAKHIAWAYLKEYSRPLWRSEEHTSELQSLTNLVCR